MVVTMYSSTSFTARADLGDVRSAEAPPSRFIAPLSKVLLAERGTGKSRSSVSLDNLRVMATVEEGRMEGRVVAKRLGDDL